MLEHVRKILEGQFEAGLCMLDECIRRCPPEQWDGRIAKYPFWHVAYHTLCFVDVYLSRRDEEWKPQVGEGGMHPLGRTELDEEYPSRSFEQQELLDYLAFCRRKLGDALGTETNESLQGGSGFAHLPISRMELHVYNIRHIQHHTGQLSAFVRKAGVNTRWVKTGWRER